MLLKNSVSLFTSVLNGHKAMNLSASVNCDFMNIVQKLILYTFYNVSFCIWYIWYIISKIYFWCIFIHNFTIIHCFLTDIVGDILCFLNCVFSSVSLVFFKLRICISQESDWLRKVKYFFYLTVYSAVSNLNLNIPFSYWFHFFNYYVMVFFVIL